MSGKTKVLVTGSGGFIGSALVTALRDLGQNVRTLDIRPTPLDEGETGEHWTGSFLDRSVVQEVLVDVDIVFHLAATNYPRESNLDPLRDAQNNLIGSLQLLDMAAKSGVRRFVFASSGGTVYGPTGNLPIREDEPQNPSSAYGICKLAMEKYLRFYNTETLIETLSLRIANPYGPGQSIAKAQGALTTFVHRAIEGRQIEIWGDGSVERDFVFIDDVARALVAASECSVSGEEINIGSSRGTSLNDLVVAIELGLNQTLDVKYSEARGFDVPANYLDISKANQLLGWAPKIDLETGLRLMIDALK